MADETRDEQTAALSARLPADLVEFVEALAAKEGRSKTAQLAYMLRNYKTFERVIEKLRVERDYPEAQAS